MISTTPLYQRPQESAAAAKLSLISLMDIFTILVFFLMLSSGETQNIEEVKVVKLPDSIAGTSPHTDFTIHVSEQHIIVNSVEISETASILKNPDEDIAPLAEILTKHRETLSDASEAQKKLGYAVTILADKNVSYEILKSVMSTCQQHNFRSISLAVNRVAGGKAAKSPSVDVASATLLGGS
ncbi:MAG: biopolymer transporter ExbD [Alteromonadaceae bacterium]|nr:MAG: biopolymer transporter ExbD [Alteromonadaceae bacterium]